MNGERGLGGFSPPLEGQSDGGGSQKLSRVVVIEAVPKKRTEAEKLQNWTGLLPTDFRIRVATETVQKAKAKPKTKKQQLADEINSEW